MYAFKYMSEKAVVSCETAIKMYLQFYWCWCQGAVHFTKAI